MFYNLHCIVTNIVALQNSMNTFSCWTPFSFCKLTWEHEYFERHSVSPSQSHELGRIHVKWRRQQAIRLRDYTVWADLCYTNLTFIYTPRDYGFFFRFVISWWTSILSCHKGVNLWAPRHFAFMTRNIEGLFTSSDTDIWPEIQPVMATNRGVYNELIQTEIWAKWVPNPICSSNCPSPLAQC